MSWLASFGVALLTAILAGVAAMLVAIGWSTWYHWSSFEGASGYATVAWTLAGLLVGLLLGLVVSRLVDAGGAHAFLRALGVSTAIVAVTAGALAAGGRLMADVPPEIDGETLMLMVELRWPESQRERPAVAGPSLLRLGAGSARTVRRSELGPLWTGEMRRVDGRWVADGAVPVFTERGERLLELELERPTPGAAQHGFLVPLARRPGKEALRWSDWLPRSRDGAGAFPGGLTYRFRVQRRSEPVRTDTVGGFEVATIADRFAEATDDTRQLTATSTFRVLHRGRPVAFDAGAAPADGSATGVAVVAAPRPTLLVRVEGGGDDCVLLVDEGEAARVTRIAACGYSLAARPLTADTARFRSARQGTPAGWIDRATLGEMGDYVVGDAVLDTRRLLARRVPPDSTSYPVQEIPALALSPDGESLARVVRPASRSDALAVGVTHLASGRTYHLPIDPLRQRFAAEDAIDPAWLAHHFAWTRDAAGVDRLVERPDVRPLPFRGTLMPERPGAAAFYSVKPAGVALRDALADLVAAEFGAERLPGSAGSDTRRMRIDGTILHVSAVEGGSEPFVAISVESGTDERHVVPRVARHVDAALATGRFDALFIGS